MSIVITGVGSYLPSKVVSNAELAGGVRDFDSAKRGGISLDTWARTKHGAVTRHHATSETTAEMATRAGAAALADAGLSGADVQLIVMATITDDKCLPQAAAYVQANLKAGGKYLQLDAACSGFIDSMMVAHGLMETLGYSTSLVISADRLTAITDLSSSVSATVFGDGAGAVVLQRQERAEFRGLKAFSSGSEGHLGDHIVSERAYAPEVLLAGKHYMRLHWPEVRSWAAAKLAASTREVVQKSSLSLSDVRWIVPHNASIAVIHDAAEALQLPRERFIITYDHTGNVGSSSVPVALAEAKRKGLLEDGDWLVMSAMGAGLAWGALTCRWRGAA